jgi:CheY-like chemotaxis protein
MFNEVHILVVEDDPSSADVLGDLLRQLRLSYTVVCDSEQALPAIYNMQRLDAIFLDLELPNGNGFDVLANIKADPTLAHIPVVAYTSHLSEMANAREAGFHSFLGKPIRGKDFPDQLASILNNQRVWVVR